MASILLKPELHRAKVVDAFDCSCGGRVVVKGFPFENRWKKAGEDGLVRSSISRYYARCLTCGEVTEWRFSASEAKDDFIAGRLIEGSFDKNGKFRIHGVKSDHGKEG